MTLRSLPVGVIFVLATSLLLPAREWSDSTGQFKVEAQLVSKDATNVRLRKPDGMVITVPIARLSPADQAFLRQAAGAAGRVANPPRLAPDAALRKKVEPVIDVVEIRLRELVSLFADRGNVNIFIDDHELYDSGVMWDTPVTFKSRGGTIAEELTAVLKDLKLTWANLGDALLITTADAAHRHMQISVYRIARGIDPDDVIAKVTQRIAPESWNDNGGAGAIEVVGQVVAVCQTPQNLAELEAAYARELRKVPPTAPRPTKLDKVIDVEAFEMSLEQFVKHLSEESNLNFSLDTRALEDEGITPDMLVTVYGKQVTVRTVIRLVGLQHPGVGVVPDREGYKLTTAVMRERELVGQRYRVADLVVARGAAMADFDPLLDMITRIVDPLSWDEVGGAGRINTTGALELDIMQNVDNHARIAQLLADIRAALK